MRALACATRARISAWLWLARGAVLGMVAPGEYGLELIERASINLRGERDGARERDGCSAARVGVDEAHKPVHVRTEEVQWGSHAGLARAGR